VREYYESSYVLALPVALLRRLEGKPFAAAGSLEDAGSFPDFLDITHPIENDDDLESFLWLLDGGARYDEDEEGWVDIDSARDVFADQERFLEVVGSRSRAPLASSVRGFGKFVEFCRSLDRMLRRRELPLLLRAYYWHYHEYWFGQLAHHLKREVRIGIDAFAAWKGQEAWTRRRYEADRRQTMAAIARLTSGRYGAALTRRLPDDVRRAFMQ
ncbi:MAG: hypothetical protein HOP15_09735, partial [Planctomycetes bacterium]|nr:hypothetical protein [Planctomycetota bacterium]